MSISQFLPEAIKWLAWLGLAFGLFTIIAFLFSFGVRFRLLGATIFTLLLSGSCWAFKESYNPPVTIEGALYVPVVYDNGSNLVVAQAPEDFPKEAIAPSLEQIAKNLKGGGRNGAKVKIRIRKIESKANGISTPIVLGEAIKDSSTNKLLPIEQKILIKQTQKEDLGNTSMNVLKSNDDEEMNLDLDLAQNRIQLTEEEI
ncbi:MULTISPECIES: Ycf51 family protein [unclassified Prochlorococcus]|uniref:Ycf51 family protein n=1 Tax=unclassified Prochlorococcus TaxID=2627481 RepID=UPI0005337FF2|nr:hypothetical protein EV06_1270 [Prochlorococcus sp. MIT 0602]KGG17677.1 hypothetical protein EV07_1117 [Prochlorococcus sp. MIT 0603]